MSDMDRRRSARVIASDVGMWIARLLLLAFIFLPIYNALLVSLQPTNLSPQGIVPTHFHWQNYVEVFGSIDLGQQILNSMLYATSITALNLLVTVPASYALSRYEFRGQAAFMLALLITQMFAAIIILPALYVLIRALGLLDTYVAVILTIGAITIPLSTWLLKGFFDSFPVDVEEAAMIDGLSRLQIILKVVLPMSKPGILTASIFTFISGYQNFLIPLVFLSDSSKVPITVGIFNLFGEMNPPHHYVMAATFISILPIILLYFFAQDYIIEGLTASGTKM